VDGHKHGRTVSKSGTEAWWFAGTLIILCFRDGNSLHNFSGELFKN